MRVCVCQSLCYVHSMQEAPRMHRCIEGVKGLMPKLPRPYAAGHRHVPAVCPQTPFPLVALMALVVLGSTLWSGYLMATSGPNPQSVLAALPGGGVVSVSLQVCACCIGGLERSTGPPHQRRRLCCSYIASQ